MPTVNVPSASVRTHSWLSVYLSSAGVFIADLRGYRCVSFLDQHRAVTHERRLDDARFDILLADLDRDRVAHSGSGWNAGQSNRLSHRGREGAAGDLAFTVIGEHALMAAQDAFVEQQEADLRSSGRLGRQCGLADEVARARKVHGPGKAGLERRFTLGHVLPVEIHSRLEAQRVAGAESARPYSSRSQP